MPINKRTPEEEQMDLIKADFRNFLYVVWQFLNLPEPTPIQYDIAYHMQHGGKREIYEAFRGVGKSWICAAFVLWVLLRDPQMRIMVVSASKLRADGFSKFCKQLIDNMPILAHLKPRPGQLDSVIAFEVGPALPSQSPSVKSVGITGQLTGSRADLVIADDVEVPSNSGTQTMRDKLSELVKEFDALLTAKESSRIIYLGTPQTEMSLYNTLLDRGYTMQIWPARYPEAKQRDRYAERLAAIIKNAMDRDPTLVGKSTDPKRFNDKDLIERELSYGRSGFAMQFQLDTSASDTDRYPLKLRDLMVMPLSGELAPVKPIWGSSPENIHRDVPCVGLSGDYLYRPMALSRDKHTHDILMAEYTGTVMTIDPAGRGGDELAYAIVSHLNGFLYVRKCKGLKGGYTDDNLEHLARMAKAHNVKLIITESNFGDGMFDKLLQPHLERIYPCTIEQVRHSKQKELRIIDTLEPVMNQHRLVFDEAVIREDFENYNEYSEDTANRYQLMYQMTRITKERGALAKDDRIDVLAMAVAYWVDSMAKDQERIDQEHQEELLERELEVFAEEYYGGSGGSSRNNWMG